MDDEKQIQNLTKCKVNRTSDRFPVFGQTIQYINNNQYPINPINGSNQIKKYNRDCIRSYISLTTTPARFFDPEFMTVLDNLSRQSVKPTKIFVSYCRTYRRTFESHDKQSIKQRIKYIKSKHPLVRVIRTKDYGPATKILGLLEHNKSENFLKDTDLIVVLDDDMLYSSTMLMSHMYCNQLYGCDVSAVDQQFIIQRWDPYKFKSSDIFYKTGYQGLLYGWLSFGIMYRATNRLLSYWEAMVKRYPDIWYHDDLLFTMYCYQNKLYEVENRFHTIDCTKNKTQIDNVQPLRSHIFVDKSRYGLEKKVFAGFNVDSQHGKLVSKDTVYNIPKNIRRRSIKLIDGLKILNPHTNIHAIFSYLGIHTMMMTVTVFDISLLGSNHELFFTIHGVKHSVLIEIEHNVKFTHILYLSMNIFPKKHSNQKKHKIIQTHVSNKMSENRFNSIQTILNYGPEFSYIFFDNSALHGFIAMNYSKIVNHAIEALNPGAYISDIFRYCYLWIHGGIYIDCKKIMCIALSDYIGSMDNIFIKDLIPGNAYNAIMVSNKNSQIMKDCLMTCVNNIISMQYTDTDLGITGPRVLGDAIPNDYNYQYVNVNGNKSSFILNPRNELVIVNAYHGYYKENNYLNSNHYSTLWRQRDVYGVDLRNRYTVSDNHQLLKR